MPIGKNSIKRVANNGYSNVKSAAPDMENSTVEEKNQKKAPAPKANAKKTSATQNKSTETAKKSAKATPKKSMESEPVLAPVTTAQTVIGKNEENSAQYVNLGRELPVYLL